MITQQNNALGKIHSLTRLSYTSINIIVKLCPTTTPISVKMTFHKKDTRI